MMSNANPAPNSGKWSPSADFCAQSAHVGWSLGIVGLLAVHGVPPWWAVVGIVAIAAFKEFVADLTFLEHDTLAGSVTDFAFYVLGSLAAWLACWSLWAGVAVAVTLIAGLMLWDMEQQGAIDEYPYD